MGDPFNELLVVDETIEGGMGNARTLGLAAGDQAPLICRDRGQAADGCSSGHSCNIPHK